VTNATESGTQRATFTITNDDVPTVTLGLNPTSPLENSGGSATVLPSDTADELDPTVIVDIASVQNGTESAPNQVTVTITDDDP
jgi:hypothetical protein